MSRRDNSEFTTIHRGDYNSRKRYVRKEQRARKKQERAIARRANKREKAQTEARIRAEKEAEAEITASLQKSTKSANPKKSFGKRLSKVLLIILIIVVVLVGATLGGMYIFSLDYYKPTYVALNAMDDCKYTVTNDYYMLKGDSTGAFYDGDKALVFYPGGKVDERAYIPFLMQLQKQGITVFMPKMPLHFAFLNASAAEDIMADHPEYNHWFLAGHSLGGVIASMYYAQGEDRFDRVILMGSYIYGDVENRDKVLIIYGTEDVNLKLDKILPTDHTYVIEGGNHAKFANYGEQKGDGEATISAKEQQSQAVEAILNWIGGK